jgi:hypothetical protein
MRRPFLVPSAIASAALLAVTLLAACGNDDGGAQIASAAGTSAAAAPGAQEGCQEDLVREAIDNSGAIAPELEYEITYLKCAEGFGWALVDPIPENFDTGTALLRVTGTEVELLELGTSFCTADFGIPAEVAAQIAPPGADPAGDCPGPAPAPGEPGAPVRAEPNFTG